MTARQTLMLQQAHKHLLAAAGLLARQMDLFDTDRTAARQELTLADQLINELRYGPPPATRRATDHARALERAHVRAQRAKEKEAAMKRREYERRKERVNE